MNEHNTNTQATTPDETPIELSRGYVPYTGGTGSYASGTPTVGLGGPARPKPTGPRTVADLIRRAEFWLNKVGIVLFLFGVVFFFKYALDHEWISEAYRVGIGALLGLALLGCGLALHRKMRHFSQVLMGGGIATLYITAFSAYVLFTSLRIPYDLAFGAMASVTALAFALSLWGDDIALALTGVLGGLLTPFALGFTHIEASPLMIYTRLLLVAVGAIFLFRGWRSLLWTSAIGTVALFVAVVSTTGFGAIHYAVGLGAELDVQVTVLVALLTFWVAPVAHELLSWGRPMLFRKPPVRRLTDPALRPMLDWHLYVLPVLASFLALGVSAYTWGNHVPQVAWGAITLGLAVICGAAAVYIRNEHGPLSVLHRWLGIALGTLGLVLFSGAYWLWDERGGLVLLTLAVQATILHAVAARYPDRKLTMLADVMHIVSATWLLSRLVDYQIVQTGLLTRLADYRDAIPVIFNRASLLDLAVIGLLFATSLIVRRPAASFVYQLTACMGSLLWLVRATQGMDVVQRINCVVLLLAFFGALLHVVASRAAAREDEKSSLWARVAAHGLFGIAGSWITARIAWGLLTVNPDGTPIYNPRGLTDLCTILLAAFTAYLLRNDSDRRPLLVYGLWLHAAFLGWSWQEIGLMNNGNGFVTIVWGAYSLILIGAALYFMKQANDGKTMDDGHSTAGGWTGLLNTPRMVTLILGLLTLFGVAAKLFLVDLRYVDAIWRILLFLGFGALFLLISFGFGTMTRRAEE